MDAPAELGKFDVTRFEVEGKPHYFAATPAGAFSPDKTEKLVAALGKLASVQSAIFGGPPYDHYVYFYLFWPPGATQQGYLEHLNSQVAIFPPGETFPVEPDGGQFGRRRTNFLPVERKAHPPHRDVALRLCA